MNDKYFKLKISDIIKCLQFGILLISTKKKNIVYSKHCQNGDKKYRVVSISPKLVDELKFLNKFDISDENNWRVRN